MMKATISSSRASGAPVSAGVVAGGIVFIAGQVGIDASGHLHPDAASQTAQALANVFEVLASAGLDARSVVKTTVFLTDRADLAEMNEAYGRSFPPPYPARSTVIVAGLPREGARVEIEAIAIETATEGTTR